MNSIVEVRVNCEWYINNVVNDVINRMDLFTLDEFYRLINTNINGISCYPKGDDIEVVISTYGFQIYKTYLKYEIESRIERRKLCS